MDFKNLLSQLDQLNKAPAKTGKGQLNEATQETEKGRVHKAGPGGYGRKFDTDEEGDESSEKKAEPTASRGRGRPKKGADDTGAVKSYDTSGIGAIAGGGKAVKSKALDSLPSKKHKVSDKEPKAKASLKDWFEQLGKNLIAESDSVSEAFNGDWGNLSKSQFKRHELEHELGHETEPTRSRSYPRSSAPAAGGGSHDVHINGKKWKTFPTKSHAENVAKKIAGASVKPSAGIKEADQIEIKPASQMPKQPGQTSMPGQTQPQVAGQPAQNTQVIAQGNKTLGTVNNPQLAQQIKQSLGKGEMTLMPNQTMAEAGDEGKPGKNFAKIAAKAGKEYGSKEAGQRVAGAVRAKLMKQGKIREGDMPPMDGNMSPMTLEGKKAKPDFLDVDKDGDKKESFKKAVSDKEGKSSDKKKVKEGTQHSLKAAHLKGRAHALAKENYNCRYDDMEEARQYHLGYKKGLDECYGQMPIQGQVVETNPSVVDDMASFGAHTPQIADEGNAFTAALARTPNGGKFNLGGKSMTDRSGYDATFESWDQDLSALLTEYKDISEGVSISSSTGQEGSPNSVSINATDDDATAVLSMIKQLGLGGFGGGEEQAQVGKSSPMSIAVDGEPMQAGIDVVDDHDGMMSLIKKVTGGDQRTGPEAGFNGQGEEAGQDYEDEAGEESCDSCGSSDCQCDDSEEEMVDEEESEDQMEYEVAEDNAPDTGAAETTSDENAEAGEDAALAAADAGQDAEEGEEDAAEDEEETVEESFANGADDAFETDIAFMTKVISGGLNKQKSTGQTTQPVIAGQNDRMGYNGTTNESALNLLHDWKKLSGIK